MTILIIKVMTLIVMALVNSEKSMYDSVIRMTVTVLMMMKKTFSTRYLFSLQIKRDLASGQLQVKIGAKFLT